MADLATSLVRENVDIIVTGGTGATVAAKQVTQTIPIVMAAVGDPVELGLVASLARPGGNITGIAGLSGEISGKRLALLKEAIPRLVRVAVLWNPTNTPASTLQVKNLAQAARSLAIQIQLLEARDAPDFDGAFQAAVRGRAQAVLATADPWFSVHRARLAELALYHRLPMFGSDVAFSAAGGLMNFGGNVFEAWRHSAVFVDKILKGAKPADLPVEQLTKFELVINLKTATALGLTIPQSLLQRADQVIE